MMSTKGTNTRVLPLSFLTAGQQAFIKEIKGNDRQKHYLKTLGFVSGAKITLISKASRNYIVKIGESRIAVDPVLVGRILITTELSNEVPK